MEIKLNSYDDEVDIVTSTGVRIHVRPVEVKKQVGVAGITDQIEVFAVLPVKVGRPAGCIAFFLNAHYTLPRREHDAP